MNQNPSIWGPSYWRFIHYFALYQETTAEFIKTLQPLIPCETCRTEWFDPEPTGNMVLWSIALHNKVNTKLGKYDRWTQNDFTIAHKPTCDICVPQGRPVFPWPFIHSIAEQNTVDAKNFLQEFNKLYPCHSCRSTFFTDEPAEGESVLDWTIRHHTKKDSSFVYKISTNGCKCCPENTHLKEKEQ